MVETTACHKIEGGPEGKDREMDDVSQETDLLS